MTESAYALIMHDLRTLANGLDKSGDPVPLLPAHATPADREHDCGYREAMRLAARLVRDVLGSAAVASG